MGRVGVFIDGAYLDYVVKQLGAKVDLAAFAAKLAAPDELLRTYYYHCLPYQSPTEPRRNPSDSVVRRSSFTLSVVWTGSKLGRVD